MNDTLNRKVYAEEIAEEIGERYESEAAAEKKDKNYKRENIVFAISGKWGEGKTGILDLMEQPLEKRGFKIIRFNPWKYSQEDITLKRAFLKTVRDKLRPNVNLDDLYYDKTRTNISWDNIKLPSWIASENVILTSLILSFLFILDVPSLKITTGIINFFRPIVGWTILPFLTLLAIPLILKTITSESRSASVTTAEEFEDKFIELLGKNKKMVIFIDDLDRCTPETVKLILDSLKTFFLHPECSYVITGDHTIIERFAGNELKLQNTTSGKQLEEGRRFLKKLFDVYWRVPFPSPFQFKHFVDREINSSKINFPNDVNLSNFINFLTNDGFFERNPRHVKRFITKLRFALEGVKLQIKQIAEELKTGENNTLKDSKKSLEDILNNPDLLAKILLIEENFYSLYEWLVINPEKLIEHEKLLRKRKEINESVLDDKTKSLLGDNESLYDQLVNINPKFTNEDNSVIHEVSNYFLVSGSTGLPSNLGPDESNFIEYIKSGQLNEKLGKVLEGGTTPDRNKTFAQKALKLYDETPEVEESKKTEKINIISESLKLCSIIKEWADELEVWKERVYKLSPEEQKEIFKLFFQAAVLKSPALITKIKQERPELFPLIWEVLPNIERKDWNQDSQNVLFDIAKICLKPESLDVKTLESYLQANLPADFEKEILKSLQNPDSCKLYINQVKTANLAGGKFALIRLTQINQIPS